MTAKVRKLRWFTYLLLPVTGLVVCFALGLSILQTDKDRALMEKREQSQTKLLKITFELKLQQTVSDIELLAALSKDEAGNAASPSADLAQQYFAFSQSRKIYDQVRYISPDGAELIRINLVAGHPQLVSPAALQGKGKRYYVQDNLDLPFSQVYLSPLDLNIEHGDIELPFKPMLRLVKTLPGHHNQVQGLVVLNFLAEDLLTLSAGGTDDYSYHLLVNRDGYYLKGLTPEQEWGFMFSERHQSQMQERSAEVWQQISATERGTIYSTEGLYVFETVRPIRPGQVSSSGSALAYAPSSRQLGPEDYHWKLISYVPSAALPHWLGQNLKQALLSAFPFWVLLTVLSWFLARAIVKRQLAEAELQAANRQLEERVAQRTKELQQTHNRMEQILNAAGEGIYGTDIDGRVVFVNHTACQILGWQADELIGKDLHDLVMHGDGQGQPVKHENCIVKQTLKTGISCADQNAVFRTREQKQLEVILNCNVIRTQGQVSGVVVSFRDVTLVRKAQKMEAIGTLASGIVHDFNNILTAIRGYTALAGEHLNKGLDARPALENVALASERAALLVSQLLTFSRHQEVTNAPCCLQAGIRDSLQMLRATLPSTITINERCSAEGLWSPISETRFSQVMMNLTTNAAYALKERVDGQIVIELYKYAVSIEEAQGLGLPAGEYALLSVNDNGSGIAKENLTAIFEPFFTTKPVTEGTGLGLAAVAGIVKSCGGTIKVDSAPGEGTTFTLYLPCCTAPEVAAPLSAQELIPSDTMSAFAAKILFVDDERMLVELGEQFLEALGYEVSAINDSCEALDLFSVNPEGYDLLITDQTMPRLTGLALIREVRKIRPDLPVIICSGLLAPEDNGSAEQDAVIYLKKPWTPDELGKTIVQALSGSVKGSESPPYGATGSA